MYQTFNLHRPGVVLLLAKSLALVCSWDWSVFGLASSKPLQMMTDSVLWMSDSSVMMCNGRFSSTEYKVA